MRDDGAVEYESYGNDRLGPSAQVRFKEVFMIEHSSRPEGEREAASVSLARQPQSDVDQGLRDGRGPDRFVLMSDAVVKLAEDGVSLRRQCIHGEVKDFGEALRPLLSNAAQLVPRHDSAAAEFIRSVALQCNEKVISGYVLSLMSIADRAQYERVKPLHDALWILAEETSEHKIKYAEEGVAWHVNSREGVELTIDFALACNRSVDHIARALRRAPDSATVNTTLLERVTALEVSGTLDRRSASLLSGVHLSDPLVVEHLKNAALEKAPVSHAFRCAALRRLASCADQEIVSYAAEHYWRPGVEKENVHDLRRACYWILDENRSTAIIAPFIGFVRACEKGQVAAAWKLASTESTSVLKAAHRFAQLMVNSKELDDRLTDAKIQLIRTRIPELVEFADRVPTGEWKYWK